MKTRIRYSTTLVLGVAMLTFSQIAWSLGLGAAKVDSFLNQPLAVKIELITQTSDDLSAISAGLASAEDYELIGASRDDISVPLSFAVEGSPGAAFVVVRSQLAVNNPVVRLIVEVNWASGRMLREYTLFLDPATFSQPAPAPAPRQETIPKQPQAAPPAPQATAEPAQPGSQPAAPAPVSEAGSDFVGASEYGPVQSGETLWRIAKDWSEGSGHTINQVMLAIQRNNPQAFSKNNINLLQRGAILRMPAADEVASMSASEATSEVRSQAEAFKARQNMASTSTPLLVDQNTAPLAVEATREASEEAGQEAAADSALSEEDSMEEQSLAGEDVAEEALESEPMSLEPEPQLELVPPSGDSELDSSYGFEESEVDTEASDSVQTLREELARKEEELINQQQQNAYLEQRLSEMETQVAESKAAVEDQNLSSMEERVRQERLAESQKDDEPWYSGLILWLLGLLVIVAVIAGWFMSRRGGSAEAIASSASAGETLKGIKDEAEDVLRVLDKDLKAGGKKKAPKEDVAEEADADSTVIAPPPGRGNKNFGNTEGEAEVLDEESADPEIQLDLARAYISMGDKEAARVILDEVISHGSEAQKSEAAKMKDFL